MIAYEIIAYNKLYYNTFCAIVTNDTIYYYKNVKLKKEFVVFINITLNLILS